MEVVNELNKLDDNARRQLERKLGYKSLKTVIGDIAKAEHERDSILEMQFSGLTRGELKMIKDTIKPYADLTMAYIANGIIKVNKHQESEGLEFGTNAMYFDVILNSDKIVAIDDTIIQYKENYKKMITDGDYNKIPQLLKANESDDLNNIIIEKPKRNMTEFATTGTEGKRRTTLCADYFVDADYYGNHYVSYWVHTYNEKKNWRGKWVANDATNIVDGEYTYLIDFNGDGIDDEVATVSYGPQMTPYHPTFTTSYLYPTDIYHSWYPFQIFIRNATWHTTRSGTSLYITVTH